MKVPAELLVYPTVVSTQDTVRESLIAQGHARNVLALEQTRGRGRLGRPWHSPKGECLAMSIPLLEYAEWPAMHLLGMAVSIAAAQALGAKLRWPNDLVLETPHGLRKLGGTLGEVVKLRDGRAVPVIGVGANLSVAEFPPNLQGIATSLFLAGIAAPSPEDAAKKLLAEMTHVPEPRAWADIADAWMSRDMTPGKAFKMPDGRVGNAIAVNGKGYLIVDLDGEIAEVPSAEALRG